MTTADLASWLLSDEGPIAEDEADARAALQPGRKWAAEDRGVITAWDEGDWTQWRPTDTKAISYHIARWDPARVLAECAAKRRAVELARDALGEVVGDPYRAEELDRSDELAHATLLALAQPYAARSGWREEWSA